MLITARGSQWWRANLVTTVGIVVVEAWRLELTRRTALGYFTLKALLLYPTYAIIVKLHGRDVSYVAIFLPETADLLGL